VPFEPLRAAFVLCAKTHVSARRKFTSEQTRTAMASAGTTGKPIRLTSRGSRARFPVIEMEPLER
jgi:hypothetical protein